MPKIVYPLSPEIDELRRIVGNDYDLHSKVDNIVTTIGTPTDTDVSTDIANIKTVVDANSSALTNGTYGLSALNTDLGNIEDDTQDIQTRIGTAADTDIATDIANVKTVVDANSSALTNGTYGLSALNTAIAGVQSDTDDIQATLGTPVATVSDDLASLKSLVENMSNVVRESISVAPMMEIPGSGTSYFDVSVRLFAFDGTGLEDPDSSAMYYRLVDMGGSTKTGIYFSDNGGTAITAEGSGDYTGWYALTRASLGKYGAYIGVANTESISSYRLEVGYKEGTNAFEAVRSVSFVDYEATTTAAGAVWDEALAAHTTAGTSGKALSDVLTDTGTTLPGLIGTPVNLGSGAALGENLSDIAGATFVSSTDSLEAIRNELDNGTYGLSALDTDLGNIEDDTQDIQTRIGTLTDILGTGNASLADIFTDLGGATFNTTTDSNEAIRNRLDALVGAPADTDISTDIANVKSDLATVDNNVDQLLLDVAAVKTDTGNIEIDTQDIQSKIGDMSDIAGSGNASVADALTDIAGATFDTATDSLEAIRGALDALTAHSTSFKATKAFSSLAVPGDSTLTISTADGFDMYNANIKYIKVTSTASTDFDFYLYEKDGNQDLLVQAEEYSSTEPLVWDCDLIFRNNDTSAAKNIYVRIVNNSGATSNFAVEIRGVKNSD